MLGSRSGRVLGLGACHTTVAAIAATPIAATRHPRPPRDRRRSAASSSAIDANRASGPSAIARVSGAAIARGNRDDRGGPAVIAASRATGSTGKGRTPVSSSHAMTAQAN